MKTTSFIIMILAACGAYAQNRIDLSIVNGAAQSTLIISDNDLFTEKPIRYVGGIEGTIHLNGHFGITTGVFYQSKGSGYNQQYVSAHYTVKEYSIPLMIRASLFQKHKLFVEAGGYFGITSKTQYEEQYDYTPDPQYNFYHKGFIDAYGNDIGIRGAVGARFQIGTHFAVVPKVYTEYGLTDVMKNTKSRAYGATVGITYSIGKEL